MPYYQDTAGTVLATAPDQAVARISRVSGTVDATQATAGARPTLARWPKGGRRNNVLYSEDIAGNAFWTVVGYTTNSQLITGTIYGTAIDTDMRQHAVYDRTNLAFIIPRTAWVAGDGRKSITFTAPAGCVEANFYPATKDGSKQIYSQTVSAVVTPGQTYTASWYTSGNSFGGVQVEIGPLATGYQKTVTANDITQAGVPDVFHLRNDGGDSMPAAAVPAGTYGLSYVDVLGNVTHTTVTSDGTTPINLLRTDRQVDVVMRAVAFTATEKARLTSYWGYLK